MENKEPSQLEQIASITGLKRWKVALVLHNNASSNLHRVTDEEMAVILHAAADVGYVNKGISGNLKGKKIKGVTLNDLAKRAGVSISCASAAFEKYNSFAGMSKETRLHILAIAKDLGYKPTKSRNIKNYYARNSPK